MVLLALDSGLERTGFACFRLIQGKQTLVDYGCIMTEREHSLTNRIKKLAHELTKLIKKNHPDQIVLEQLFFNHNQKTAIMVSQAQGASILVAALNDIPVDFIAPLAVKQAVTGYGLADKRAVEKMVMLELGIKKAPQPDDVIDAIACGLAYCSVNKLKMVIEQQQ